MLRCLSGLLLPFLALPLAAQEQDPVAVAEYREQVAAGQERALAQDWVAALPRLDRALELFPGDPVALRWRGHTLTGLGRYEDAFADLDVALRADAADAWTQYARAMALHHLGRHEDAVLGYSAALTADPSFTKANQWRGFTRSLMGDQVGAIADIDVALAADPGNAELYFIRAKAWVALTEFERAELDFWKVADIDETHADSRAQLGYLYACQGLDDSARRLLREAIRIDAAGQTEARLWLAQLEAARGDEAAAAEQLDAVGATAREAPEDAAARWTGRIAACLQRRLAADRLLAAIPDGVEDDPDEQRGRRCEALLHIGLLQRREGRSDAALGSLARAVGTAAREKWEWSFAVRALGAD